VPPVDLHGACGAAVLCVATARGPLAGGVLAFVVDLHDVGQGDQARAAPRRAPRRWSAKELRHSPLGSLQLERSHALARIRIVEQGLELGQMFDKEPPLLFTAHDVRHVFAKELADKLHIKPVDLRRVS
jgi:hypothetical protein